MLLYVREELSAKQFDTVLQHTHGGGSSLLDAALPTLEERRATGRSQMGWWGLITDTYDRATVMLPGLLAERMGELGIDFEVLYPSLTFGSAHIRDAEIRHGWMRGVNRYYADVYGPFRDRIVVPGIIPMDTPEEAIAELRHCHELGLKAAVVPHGVLRDVARPLGNDSGGYMRTSNPSLWFDTYGLDSAYDYDPVWATFVELGYAVTSHHGISSYAPERSWPSNHAAGHIGSHAASMSRLCKSFYFGGVTRRFPKLQVAFLECGVSWAAQMLADLVEHWEKRRPEALALLNPDRIDVDRLASLFEAYGGNLVPRGCDHDQLVLDLDSDLDPHRPAPDDDDNFANINAASRQELVELFAKSFYFGCEADDVLVGTAYSPGLPCGAVLKPMFSSDIAHWDVPDIAEVLPEAFEQVEHGLLTPEQFRAFVFENPAQLYLRANPGFFDGTTIEAQARDLGAALPS
jgi:predicted TIM-barrel fold metal-dependent hydrolase